MSDNKNVNKAPKEKKVKEAVDNRSKVLKLTSIFSVIILIAIVILFNVIIDKILGKSLSFDMTASGHNTISEQSEEYLNSLPDGASIRIVGLFEEPASYSDTPLEYIVPLLQDYAKKSSGKVTVEYVDPTAYPYIISELDPTGIYDVANSAGLYAVCYEGKVSIIDPYDCFTYEQIFNESIGQPVDQPRYNIAESKFTNTMINLTKGYTNKAYIVADPRSTVKSVQLEAMLNNLGVEVEYLDYSDANFKVPLDCEILFLNGVSSDITETCAEALNTYLSIGGKMVVTADFVRIANNGANLNNLNTKVLNNRGINIEEFTVRETNSTYMFPGDASGYVFYASTSDQDVMSLGGSDKYVVQTPFILNKVSTKYDSSMTVTSLLTSSAQAVKVDYTGTDVIQGDFSVAMKSAGVNEGTYELYVFGFTTITSDDYMSTVPSSDSNVKLIRNIVKGSLNVNDTFEVESKNLANYSIDTSKLSLNGSSAMIVILVAGIPLALIVAGVIVYTKRKNL
ncbi:MAG: GldG family protein [Saccharofermentans sp.]|nr:GldG family protein [Saccharofermentans sp.]